MKIIGIHPDQGRPSSTRPGGGASISWAVEGWLGTKSMKGKTVRFPKPWCVLENEDSFVVEDATGVVLSRVPFAVEGRRTAQNVMTKDEARRIAENMVKTTDILLPTQARSTIS